MKMDDASSSCTLTQRLQTELETVVGSLYEAFDSATDRERSLLLTLNHDEHEEYVLRGLQHLSAGYHVLDSSRPWLCYWIVHSLALLGRPVDEYLYNRTVDFLEHCKDPNGGYGGGPGQMPHLATTYAATCALVSLGGEKALASINREKILQFLLRMKDPCGGFRVHDDGEMDMRGSFTALAVAHMLDIVVPELVENVGQHVASCQTYEGGIGGEPGAEAHGGYTFCGLAALAFINQLHVLDLPSLVNWVAFCQGKVEGGFQGRTNKLVDGCYSFWQGGCFQLIQQYMPHLWAQQTMSLAALYRLQGEDEVNPNDTEKYRSGAPDSQERDIKLETQDSNAMSSEVQEDMEKQCMHARSSRLDKCTSSEKESVYGTEEALKEATGATSEDQTSRASEKKDDANHEAEECEKPTTKDIPLRDSTSDEDEVDLWDSDSKSDHNTVEKLFPMTDVCFRRVPMHVKSAELVELADDEQGAQGGVSSSSSTSTQSTIDLDTQGETLQGPIFNSQALQAYILICCQDQDGGLRDKPGKPCDYYHTCYCLSGLAVAQYSTAHRIGAPPPPSGVLGPYSNLVEATHALCNVRLDRYHAARRYFQLC